MNHCREKAGVFLCFLLLVAILCLLVLRWWGRGSHQGGGEQQKVLNDFYKSLESHRGQAILKVNRVTNLPMRIDTKSLCLCCLIFIVMSWKEVAELNLLLDFSVFFCSDRPMGHIQAENTKASIEEDCFTKSVHLT